MAMTIEERREALSAMGKTTTFYRQFHAGDALQAIDLLNKMDGVYKQTIEVEHKVLHTFVFMLPDGTKLTPGLNELPDPDVLLLANRQGDAQHTEEAT